MNVLRSIIWNFKFDGILLESWLQFLLLLVSMVHGQYGENPNILKINWKIYIMYGNILEVIQSLESLKHFSNQKTPFGHRSSIFYLRGKYTTVDDLRTPASQASPGFHAVFRSSEHDVLHAPLFSTLNFSIKTPFPLPRPFPLISPIPHFTS